MYQYNSIRKISSEQSVNDAKSGVPPALSLHDSFRKIKLSKFASMLEGVDKDFQGHNKKAM